MCVGHTGTGVKQSAACECTRVPFIKGLAFFVLVHTDVHCRTSAHGQEVVSLQELFGDEVDIFGTARVVRASDDCDDTWGSSHNEVQAFFPDFRVTCLSSAGSDPSFLFADGFLCSLLNYVQDWDFLLTDLFAAAAPNTYIMDGFEVLVASLGCIFQGFWDLEFFWTCQHAFSALGTLVDV